MSKGRRGPRQGRRNKNYSEREHAMDEFKRQHGSPANKEREISVNETKVIPDIDVPGLTPDSILMEHGKEYSP